MGLDITYYSDMKEIPKPETDECGYPMDGDIYWCTAAEYTEKNFPGRANGLKDNTYYQYQKSDGFRAGSYGGYNAWRDELAKLAGYENAAYVWENNPDGPFVDLINFSDCEGVIGPETAARLAKDFAEFDGKAKNHGNGNPWFYDLYKEWQRAFEYASQKGAVDFH